MRTQKSLHTECKPCCQPCKSMWVACALWGSHMFTVNLLDESQVCSCSLGIIHHSPFYPGGATGSWWSGSAKTPNWRRRSAAARSQRGQMPLLMYHVFQAGQQCVCVWAGVGGERTERLPRHSHIDANLTHAWALPTVCVTISASLTDLWGGSPSFSFSQMQSLAKMGVGACLRPSCPSVVRSFQVVFAEWCVGSRPLQQNAIACLPDILSNHFFAITTIITPYVSHVSSSQPSQTDIYVMPFIILQSSSIPACLQ